ncbi:hypothetical protein ACET3X_008187 [Alternaria dauci]|uniref:Velvet domain-containing protein n=1 Tax=Alternaria dauci TaxID=48095 RepID=A0ABR3UB32_9PLEO
MAYNYTKMNTGRPEPVQHQHQQAPVQGGKRYELSVEQQPIRARMCGFGDKDRRPITPPPCIRLVVTDIHTGREVDFQDIDSTYFVLMVDLYDSTGTEAVNLVRHSSAAPTVSISSSTTTSYPPQPERNHHLVTTAVPYDFRQSVMPYGTNPSAAPMGYYPQAYPMYGQPQTALIPATPAGSNHTRNLIGMNAVNACRLNDLSGKPGFWFVLQDLSVRTEGTFRLKLSLFDIGAGDGTNGTVHLNGPSKGKGPMLASAFTDPFTVYSAKKFPGVIESTKLSKCFAQQGIKIPIRKDGGPKVPNQSEFDNDG